MLLAESFFFSPEPVSAIQDFFGHGHAAWFKIFSLFGETWGVLLAIGLSLWLWGREVAYQVFLVVIVSALVKEGMNLLVTVPRPSEPSIVVYQRLETPSFPSGHVLTAVAIWAFLYLRARIHLAVASAVTILVCLGRVYLGAHYLVDVIVGAAAGIATAWALAKSWKHVCRWAERLSFRWMCAAGVVAAAAISLNLVMNSGIPHRWGVTGLAVGLMGGLLLEYWMSEKNSSERSRSPQGSPGGSRSPQGSLDGSRSGELPERSLAYELANASRAQRVGMVAAGATGIAAGYALSTVSSAYPLVIDMGATLGAALWVTSAVPLLIARRG